MIKYISKLNRLVHSSANQVSSHCFRPDGQHHDPLSQGWWIRFKRRHPDLRVRTPSLLDPARASMSRSSVMDTFFDDLKVFLEENSLLNQPHRILNIDETWDNPLQEKARKVVMGEHIENPYKIYGGTSEHITFTLCASADGIFLPPMITFRSLPRSNEFHGEGPPHALYSQSESGHTDTTLYLAYIKHIEPFLGDERPVVILQDNLAAHENLELIRFCLDHGILLYNFPSKTSHLLQPLDKLFWSLKCNITKEKVKAKLMQQGYVTKAKIPLITRYAMNAIGRHEIQEAFEKTGICPLDRSQITPDKLVSDQPTIEKQNSETADPTHANVMDRITDLNTGSIDMEVFDETNRNISVPTKACAATQTEQIKSLPCQECIQNEVSLHPAVANGIVDVSFASAFIENVTSNTSQTKKRKLQRDTSKGRCLTHETEVVRLEQISKDKKAKEEAVIKRKRDLEQRKKEKMEHEKRKLEEKDAMIRQKALQIEAERLGKIGRLIRKRCEKCHEKPAKEDICMCILSHCNTVYHRPCMVNYNESDLKEFAVICSLCQYHNSK